MKGATFCKSAVNILPSALERMVPLCKRARQSLFLSPQMALHRSPTGSKLGIISNQYVCTLNPSRSDDVRSWPAFLEEAPGVESDRPMLFIGLYWLGSEPLQYMN